MSMAEARGGAHGLSLGMVTAAIRASPRLPKACRRARARQSSTSLPMSVSKITGTGGAATASIAPARNTTMAFNTIPSLSFVLYRNQAQPARGHRRAGLARKPRFEPRQEARAVQVALANFDQRAGHHPHHVLQE